MEKVFLNREHAGRHLAEALRGQGGEVVLGLPRGGVVIAAEVAKILGLPWGLIAVRKLGVPSNPELAFGAIASGGAMVIDEDLLQRITLSEAEIESVRVKEEKELKRREALYPKTPILLEDKTVIVVDDGIATGATALAAIKALKNHKPKEIIIAAPVCAPEIPKKMQGLAKLICLQASSDFLAVGQYYQDFKQVTDKEVLALVKKA